MIMIILVTKLAKTIVMIGIVVVGSIVNNWCSLRIRQTYENQPNLWGRFLYTPTIIIALINTISGEIFIHNSINNMQENDV